MSEVTRILSAIGQGDPRAAEQLLPLVIDELRKLAAERMAQEKPGQTLQGHCPGSQGLPPAGGGRETGGGVCAFRDRNQGLVGRRGKRGQPSHRIRSPGCPRFPHGSPLFRAMWQGRGLTDPVPGVIHSVDLFPRLCFVYHARTRYNGKGISQQNSVLRAGSARAARLFS